jgi:hypothetical protein
MFQNIGGGPNQMGPSKTQNVVAPPHQLTKV